MSTPIDPASKARDFSPIDPASVARDFSPATDWARRIPSSALDRTLDIDAEIACAGVAFTEVEPAIALWVAPELVAAATALHRLAMEALADVASACAVRNTPLVRESATRLLEETLRSGWTRGPSWVCGSTGDRRRAVVCGCARNPPLSRAPSRIARS